MSKPALPPDPSSVPDWQGTDTEWVPGARPPADGAESTLAGRSPESLASAKTVGERAIDATATNAGAGALAHFQLRPGVQLGPCRIVSPLGRGGMGEVWLARNDLLGRDEAVKVLLSASGDLHQRKRFVREAQAALKLEHCPEIVRTYEIGDEDGRLFIRMEYVRGVSLDRYEPRDLPEAVAIFKRMAASLAAGHRLGVVHRDVKPSNFMLAEGGVVKLMDFGVARLGDATALTMTAASLGTPVYMSPEQWFDARSVDARADVYSLGVSFYRLLTGDLPYDASSAATPVAYQAKVMREDPRPIAAIPGRFAGLPALVLKAMAKRPAERFADAGEVLAALERLEDPAARIVAPATEAERARRARLKRLAVGGLAVVLLAAAGFGAFRLIEARRSPLAGVDAALADARRELHAAADGAAKDDPAFAVAALEVSTRDLAAADEALGEARASGVRAGELAGASRRIAAERAVAAEVGSGVEALRAHRASEARTAFDRAASLVKDEPAFAAARDRAGRAAMAAERLERAGALEATDPAGGLGLAAEARADALDSAAAGELIARLRAAVLARAHVALETARAAEERKEAGRPDAIRAYEKLLALLSPLAADERARVEAALEVRLADVQGKVDLLHLQEGYDASRRDSAAREAAPPSESSARDDRPLGPDGRRPPPGEMPPPRPDGRPPAPRPEGGPPRG